MMTNNGCWQSVHQSLFLSRLTRQMISLLLAGWTLALLSASIAWAQGADDTAQRSQLGERQRLVERKMAELENRFTVIAQQIQEKEPERAQRLIVAYQQAKERLVTQRMAEVGALLDKRQYDAAGTKLDEIIGALDDLVRVLINQKEDQMTKQQEMEMLEKWKESIQQMQREQQQQTRETENVANREEVLKDLDAQIQEVNKLIQQQQQVKTETAEQAGGNLRELDKLADRQFQVRQSTEALAQAIAGQQGQPKSPQGNSDQPSPGQQPPGQQPPGQQPPGQQPPGQQPPGQQPPGQQPPGQSGNQNQSQAPKPGQQPLQQAAASQQRAEEKMVSGKPADAQRQQQQAIEQLQQAKQELENEKRRIASLPPEALQQMAEQQRRTRDKANDLAKEMAEAPKPKSGDEGENGGNQPKSQPGQQSMQQAGESMQKAAGDLSEQEAEQAQRNQKKAEDELQQALNEIEERLNQLREETQEEKLRRLEARFREMLERQQVASIMTLEIDDRKNNLGPLGNRDQLLLLRLATEEREVSELGQQTYDLLLEDGTSNVFPEVVQELCDDLKRAGDLLQQERCDSLTQLVQREIEATLEELLEALQDTKKSGGGGGGGGSGGGEQPLIKKSAELRMLKAKQLRVNRQTRLLDQLKGQSGGDVDLESEIQSTAQRQADLIRILEKIMEEGDQ